MYSCVSPWGAMNKAFTSNKNITGPNIFHQGNNGGLSDPSSYSIVPYYPNLLTIGRVQFIQWAQHGNQSTKLSIWADWVVAHGSMTLNYFWNAQVFRVAGLLCAWVDAFEEMLIVAIFLRWPRVVVSMGQLWLNWRTCQNSGVTHVSAVYVFLWSRRLVLSSSF